MAYLHSYIKSIKVFMPPIVVKISIQAGFINGYSTKVISMRIDTNNYKQLV